MDPVMQELNALREELKRNNEALATLDAIEKRIATGETSAREAQKQMAELRETVARLEKEIEEARRKARLQGIARDGIAYRNQAYRVLGSQLREMLARHLGISLGSRFAEEREMLAQYRATLSPESAGGSYLVPTLTADEIIEGVEETSSILMLTDFRPGLPGKMDLPVLTARPTLQHKRATLATDMTTSDPAIGRVQFEPEEGYVFFPVDNRLIEMSAVDLGRLAVGWLRDAAIEGLTQDLLSGDGSSSYNEITGILNETEAAFVQSLPSQKTAFGDLTKADLQATKSKCLKRGRARGVWLVSHDVLGLIEDLDRTGKVPVVTYGQDGQPRILQNPVVIDEGMPDIADSGAGKAILAFGDLSTYLVGLVNGIQIGVSTEVLFRRNQTAFRAVLNYDIKRKPVATLITLKTAAS